MDKPTQTHIVATTRVLINMKARPGQGIFLTARSTCHLKAFSDSD